MKSKYFNQLEKILENLYPKGDKGRGKALVFLAYTELVLQGYQFKEGEPVRKLTKKVKN